MNMETPRLIIRKFKLEDLKDFSALICNKMSSEYAIYDAQFPTDAESLKELLDYLKDSDEFFAAELKALRKVIGFFSLNFVDDHTRNLGYCIHTDYQRNGFASEAVAELMKYAKEELHLNKLISGTAEANKPSMCLLARNGFKIIGKQQESFANDENGNPITFTGCLFECAL